MNILRTRLFLFASLKDPAGSKKVSPAPKPPSFYPRRVSGMSGSDDCIVYITCVQPLVDKLMARTTAVAITILKDTVDNRYHCSSPHGTFLSRLNQTQFCKSELKEFGCGSKMLITWTYPDPT